MGTGKKLHNWQDITVFLWSKASWDAVLQGLLLWVLQLLLFSGTEASLELPECFPGLIALVPRNQTSSVEVWSQYPVCRAGWLLNLNISSLEKPPDALSHVLWDLLSYGRFIPLLKPCVVSSLFFPFWKWIERRDGGTYVCFCPHFFLTPVKPVLKGLMDFLLVFEKVLVTGVLSLFTSWVQETLTLEFLQIFSVVISPW